MPSSGASKIKSLRMYILYNLRKWLESRATNKKIAISIYWIRNYLALSSAKCKNMDVQNKSLSLERREIYFKQMNYGDLSINQPL